ncbi:MAG TPA: hypothetical protein VIL74_25710 [Pyrinomonadaceae bacterium]|jgi:hypothetical protein
MIIEFFIQNAPRANAAQCSTFFPALFQTAKTTPLLVFLFVLFLIGVLLPLFIAARVTIGWWRNKKLLIEGEPAQAKILKIWQTGVTLNDDPQIGMLLEVRAENRPVFHGEAKRFVSLLQIPRVQVGSSVEVRFDPQDLSRIAVVL